MGVASWIKETWNKTVFPQKIKQYKERKKIEKQRKYEEQQYVNQIKHEAKLEAMSEAKGALKEQYKKQFVDNLTNSATKKSGMQKFADAMKIDTNKMNEKLGYGLGGNKGNQQLGSEGFGTFSQNTKQKILGDKLGNKIDSQAKIDSILGRPAKINKYNNQNIKLMSKKQNITLMPKSKISYEDKVKKYLGR